ncbi:MAG TPA: hypothetical protein VKT29_16635 [Terriglobales bacterium]|nr:hypothetical protein [Terriglobales bacterium]
MSNLASLRKALPGTAAARRLLIYLALVALLTGAGWWLWPTGQHRASRRAQVRVSSPLQPVAQRMAPPTPKLQIGEVSQNGHVVEIKGTADCDASLMINGERVPLIFDHCGFKQFLLLPDGPSTIAVTAQGSAGGVNTQTVKVNIE